MKRSDAHCAIVALTSRLDFPTWSFRSLLGFPSSQCTSMHMPRLENPADSPHPHHCGCFTWTSSTLQPSSVGTSFVLGAMPALQDHGNPCGLCIALCTLRLFCSPDCLAKTKQESHHDPRAPPQAQHAIRVGGWPLPDRDFHPARCTKLRLAH